MRLSIRASSQRGRRLLGRTSKRMSAVMEAAVLWGAVSKAACLLAFFGPVPGYGPASELAFLL